MKKNIILILLFFTYIFYAQTTPGEYTVKGVKINTKNSDFGTTFFGKDKVIFAAPKNNVVLTKTTWSGNNQAFLDLYIGTITKDGEIEGKQRVLGDVNNKFHEGIVSFTKDLKTVYFDANNYTSKNKAKKDSTGVVNIQLYKAKVNSNGEWTDVVKLPFNSDEFSTGHPSLNVDGKKLYFISDRPSSIGKTDIYVVDVNSDGTYGEPKNMGTRINTEEREMFPFISDDNVLYFSSNGLPGYGDLDVFASKIFDTTVSEPLNLENPVNSKKDDFAYIIDDSKHKGYFSSNRKGGKGDDDIYGFVASPPIHFECNQVISGIARDKDTQELLPNTEVILQDEQGNELFKVQSDAKDASFNFEVPCDTNYKIIGTQQGYLREELEIKTANDIDIDPLEVFLELSPELIVVDEKIMININTIYFDFDKWNIRPNAAKELDKVIAVLKEHPSMIIEGGSHTDSRAREAYNEILSQKRAKATVDYIIAGGIDQSRLTSKGYGEMQLVNNCSSFVTCSREEHQLNRRTEFVIVNDNDRFASTAATLEDVKVDKKANLTYVDVDRKQNQQQEQQQSVNVSSGDLWYHIIAGGFRNPKNAIKKVNQLRVKGYEARNLGVSKSGLIQVSFDSYASKEEALYHLSRIRKVEDRDAWLLVKKVISTTKNLDNVLVKNTNIAEVQPVNLLNKGYIKINPIYFGFDKWSLSKSELQQLDKVIQIMKDNPAIIVEAGAHTDSKNLESYNQILSDKRAKTVVEYIVSRGIDVKRITGKGYGEKRYVNHCRSFVSCTAAEQQENRRIEFMIVEGNNYPDTEVVEKSNGEKYINHNPVYFDFDKYDIRKDALYELKRIVKIMRENPEIKIIAESHTDSQNREIYNQELSKKRAKAVKQYIISQGINVNRIVSKGYGEMQLTNHCKSFVKCTPEEQQANRRTEFKIIKM